MAKCGRDESDGTLRVVDLPWMISPSVSNMHIHAVENGDTRVRMDVAVLVTLTGGLETRRVEVCFKWGQWVRVWPAFSDGEILPPGLYDRSAVDAAAPLDYEGDLDGDLLRLREQWVASGRCPDPRMYEVQPSSWLSTIDAEYRARLGFKHIVAVGNDAWLEVLCTDFSWAWVDEESEVIDLSSL